MGFITGLHSVPTSDSSDLQPWSRCNDMVTSWLLNSLSKEIADSVIYSRTAKDLWTSLEHRFGQSNGAKLYHLQKELSRLVQGNTNIAGYFTKLKKLWDELDSFNSNIRCTCVCNCEGKQKLQKSMDDERLIEFLMGLNDTYSQARGNILMMSPLPDINLAYSLILQDENQRESYMSPFMPSDSSSSSFMAGNINQYKGKQPRGFKTHHNELEDLFLFPDQTTFNNHKVVFPDLTTFSNHKRDQGNFRNLKGRNQSMILMLFVHIVGRLDMWMITAIG